MNNLDNNLRAVSALPYLVLAALFLSGCKTNHDQPPLSLSAIEEANQASAIARSSGAAIVARVSLDGDYCGRGKIDLHQIVEGKIVPNSKITIGQTFPEDLFTMDKAKGAFDLSAYVKVFSPDNISKSLSSEYRDYGSDFRTSFRSIRPGKYYITDLYCRTGGKEIMFGTKSNGLIYREPTGPAPGDNFITISSGQILDAGVVDIITLKNGFFAGIKGSLSSSEAPQAFRDTLKAAVPEIEAKITYTKFSPAPAR